MANNKDQMQKDSASVMNSIIRESIYEILHGCTEYFYKKSEVDLVKNELSDKKLHIEELLDECQEVWGWGVRIALPSDK